MSSDLHVDVPTTKLPTPRELIAAAIAAGFPVAPTAHAPLPDKIDVRDQTTIISAYRGETTGFHLYGRKEGNRLTLYFECSGETEMTFASIVAAMIVKLVRGGAIVDPQVPEKVEGARKALAWARKRDANYERNRPPDASKPRRKRRRPASLPLSLADIQATLDARLAKLPAPTGQPDPRARHYRVDALHEAIGEFCAELLAPHGFAHDGKGVVSRRVNGIVQAITWRGYERGFAIELAVTFDSALTGATERYWFHSLARMMPEERPPWTNGFSMQEDRFERNIVRAHAALARHGLPVFLEFDSMEKMLAGPHKPPQETGWLNWYTGLAHAHAGNIAKAKVCFRRVLDRHSAGTNQYMKDRAKRCREFLEKLGAKPTLGAVATAKKSAPKSTKKAARKPAKKAGTTRARRASRQ